MTSVTHDPALSHTRAQILDLMLQRGELTIVDLAAAMGIASGSLRRHLDILAAEGYVTSRPVRRGQGRPYFVYSATEQARESASRGYGRLLERLLREFTMLPPEAIAGADGAKVLELAFDHMGDDLARQYEPQVTANDVEGRIRQVTEALGKEGILDGWERFEGGFRLRNGSCPYRRAAFASHGPCTSERRAIEQLVGAPVAQVSRIVDGTPVCEYLVTLESTPVARTGEPD